MAFDTDRYSAVHAISWQELHWDTKELARRLLTTGKQFRRLIVVTRGGLVPAAVIARELDLRHIDTVCIASYDGQVQGATRVLKSVSGDGAGDLVIDDLVDSGSTMREIREMLPQAHLATVYAKAPGIPTVDTYVRSFDAHTWLLLPWDAELRFATPLVAD